MSNPNPPLGPQTPPVTDPNAGGFPLEVAIPGTPQVFRGNTPQEVLDALVNAQAEASRTISSERAASAQLRNELEAARQQAVPPPAASDAAKQAEIEEYYAQWSKNPDEANRLSIARILKLPPDTAVALLQKAVTGATIDAASSEFKRRYPDFPETTENAQLLAQTVEAKYGKSLAAANADNLEVAYHELVRTGRITPNTLPVSAVDRPNAVMPSLRGSSAPPDPVVDLLSKAHTMPLDKLREAIDNLPPGSGRR